MAIDKEFSDTKLIYNKTDFFDAINYSGNAVTYIGSAVDNAASLVGYGVSDPEISAMAAAIKSNVTNSKTRIGNLGDSLYSMVDYINSESELEDQITEVPFSIRYIGDGFYKVFGLGGPMEISEVCAQDLQDAINDILSVCPGVYGNNGGRVDKGGAHGAGFAFDILTTLGIRVNYDGGGDKAYYCVWNKELSKSEKTEISPYELFYVTYDGPIEDLFDENVLSKKHIYLKIRPGQEIPEGMQKYVVDGLSNIIEVDDVTESEPRLGNMHYTELSGLYLDVSQVFSDHGWESIGSYGNHGTYQSMEWHHIQYKPYKYSFPDKDEDTGEETGDENPTPSEPGQSIPDLDIELTPITAVTMEEITQIWSTNDFTKELPIVNFGQNGNIYLNNEAGFVYGVSGVTDQQYNDYVEELITEGFIFNPYGSWANGDKRLFINYNGDSMIITVFSIINPQ